MQSGILGAELAQVRSRDEADIAIAKAMASRVDPLAEVPLGAGDAAAALAEVLERASGEARSYIVENVRAVRWPASEGVAQ